MMITPEKGAEYGATTGRPRRTGWLDLPVVKQAVRINGITDIAITKIDILTGYDQIPVCAKSQISNRTSCPSGFLLRFLSNICIP